MLKVINHPVHLVKFALGVLVPDGQLITVSFADGAVFICPLIPDVAVEIVDIVGFLLPDPQQFVNMCAGWSEWEIPASDHNG